MDINGVYELLKRISKTLTTISTNSALMDFNTSSYNFLLNYSSKLEQTSAIRDIAIKNAQLLSGIDSPLFQNTLLVQDAMNLHWDTIAKLSQAYQTPELKRLSSSLVNNKIEALHSFLQAINKNSISSANMAFIKAAKIFGSSEFILPKGLPTILKEVNVGTAQKLSQSNNIALNIAQKTFYIQSNPSSRATVLEANVTLSALDIIPDISEEEAITFMNALEDNFAFACTSNIGKKVNDIVTNWNRLIGFDYDYFYHSRAYKQDQQNPYTDAQMRKAPSGVTWHGRFNCIGENHYYFSNELKGALLEVKKHSTEKKIQIAKLKPKKTIRMVDLSGNVIGKNKFLEYCRVPYNNDPSLKRHREYLFPCFVASCCRQHNIEGIKYYGSQEYQNYVSWKDDYFDIVEHKIERLS